MQAITVSTPGGPEVLRLTTVPDPTPTAAQVLVRVRATALNRADVMQRMGQYPPPPGESDILGLELAGEVEAVGAAVKDITPGDRVFGLVGSGGYAEKGVMDAPGGKAIPQGGEFAPAAAVAEGFFFCAKTPLILCGCQEGEEAPVPAPD